MVNVTLPVALVEFVDQGLAEMIEHGVIDAKPIPELRQNWMVNALVRALGLTPEAPDLQVVH